jgi:hypothetical protein
VAMMVGYPQARVLDVVEDASGVRVDLETPVDEARCSLCGGPATLSGTESVSGVVGEAFGRTSVVQWRLREWECQESGCPAGRWVEAIPARGVSRG